MFNHAPIVAAARGTGLFNMTNNFNASALISVALFCHEDGFLRTKTCAAKHIKHEYMIVNCRRNHIPEQQSRISMERRKQTS